MYHLTVLAEPLTRLVADDSGEPDTRNGGWAAVDGAAEKPSAANRPRGWVVDRQGGSVVGVDRDHAAMDGRRRRGAGDLIDLGQQRLHAVGDVELVAGRARCDEGQRRAVDGDGVAGGKAAGQRIRARCAREQRSPP